MRTFEKHMIALIVSKLNNSLIDYIEGTSDNLFHEAASKWPI